MQSNPKLLQALSRLEIEALNPMQEQALQAIQQEKDVTLLAPTGSGKTLAFLLPLWLLMDPDKKGVQCLVLSPTRELAIQIERVWQKMSTGFKVNTCYGGHSMPTEIQNLSQAPALLIGTPGRIVDHVLRKTFDMSNISMLVLDEFDKSLSMGFQEQMSDIIKALPPLNKRVLVSATDKLSIPKFTGITQSKTLNFTKSVEKSTDGLRLRTLISPDEDKLETLFELICYLGAESTLLFCNQRESCEKVSEALNHRGIQSAFFHGGMEQIEREKALVRFRNGTTVYLVASDLAARGLDIPEVKNVVHVEIPLKSTDFIHRNGRTARMHADGTAYLILHSEEALPVYLSEAPELLVLPAGLTLPQPSPWETLYISGGKKDKLSKTDILGFLAQKGGLSKEEVGKIEVLDHMSFVAVHSAAIIALLPKIQAEKMKGKKYRIGVAR